MTTASWKWTALVALSGSLIAAPSSARDLCEEYRNRAPVPDWINRHCNGAGGKLFSKVGGAYSSFADSFNTNPSTIPIEYTPVGVEFVTSYVGSANGRRSNVALIKGFERAGLGFSTDSENTFYSNSRLQSAVDRRPEMLKEINRSNLNLGQGINLGAALAPLTRFLNSQIPILPVFGLGAKYTSLSGKWSPTLGASTRMGILSAGLSYAFESSDYGSGYHFFSFTSGVKALGVQAEYVYQQTTTGTYEEPPVHIGTFSSNILGAQIVAAARMSESFDGSHRTRLHAALTYPIFLKLTLGYMYNYIPGLQSLSLQYWL